MSLYVLEEQVEMLGWKERCKVRTPFMDRFVIPSTSLLLRESTRMLKWRRKSMPMIDAGVSAMINFQVKSLRIPRFNVNNDIP